MSMILFALLFNEMCDINIYNEFIKVYGSDICILFIEVYDIIINFALN